MGISVYQLVTDRIIAELEKGNIPWNKPWTGIRSGAYSRSTGKPYSVLNQMLLMKPGGYCNRYCGRGQLFSLLGGRFGLSRKRDIPRCMKSKAFRYGFLIFFFTMFFLMLWNTYLVFAGARNLQQVVTLLWTFKLPWHWAYHGTLFHPGVAQFAFGFYSVMLTSTVLGLITMVLFKPRSWCVYCPMGTMTQLICKIKHPH